MCGAEALRSPIRMFAPALIARRSKGVEADGGAVLPGLLSSRGNEWRTTMSALLSAARSRVMSAMTPPGRGASGSDPREDVTMRTVRTVPSWNGTVISSTPGGRGESDCSPLCAVADPSARTTRSASVGRLPVDVRSTVAVSTGPEGVHRFACAEKSIGMVSVYPIRGAAQRSGLGVPC